MIAVIDEKGQLIIKPEYELESYALRKWHEDWGRQESTLCVEVMHPHTPGAKALLHVEQDNTQ